MALNIIHRGKAPDRHLIGKCRNCQTVVEGLPEDCDHHPADPRDQRDVDWYDVACPECRHRITMTRRPGP
jgi:DNA-directed RNA polymerase subunit RPC12/RpoP